MTTDHTLALATGHVVDGKYRVESILGRGGFGTAYKGVDIHLGRHAAMKEYMPRDLAARGPDGVAARPLSA